MPAAAAGCGAKPHRSRTLSPTQARIFRQARARHARADLRNAAGSVVVAIGVGRQLDRATSAYLRAVRASRPYVPAATLVRDRSFGTAGVARSLRPFCAPCAARIDAITRALSPRSITSRA